MRRLFCLLSWCALVSAQSKPSQIRPLLEAALSSPEQGAEDLRRYFYERIPKLPANATADGWTAESKRIRERVLREVVFNGWPEAWAKAPLKMEDRGALEGKGYRIRKLRYEIVPGMWGAALLYEPATPAANAQGKAPGIVNVNGHVGPPGKSVDYKQKRCIEQARMGIYAVNLEWLQYGELASDENAHANAAYLDLAGANGLGLFYLAMRRGVDILWEHEKVDRTRIGVTGLSGGGWQTIILSSLDDRVSAAVPVAGYSAMISKLERTADMGDHEQSATDLLMGQEYTHFTAMLAPRPAMIIGNAEDDCCFRAPLVKPHIFDGIRRFYRAYGKESVFEWHENMDPGDHNYELDNRQAAYRFFARAFGVKAPERESDTASEVRTQSELNVGLPEANPTIITLARKIAESRTGKGTREELRMLLRHQPTEVKHAWALRSTKNRGLETHGYRLEFANGLSATAVWLAGYEHVAPKTASIVLADAGKREASGFAADRVNRGEGVLVVDPVLFGDQTPQRSGNTGRGLYARFFYMTGERPNSVQAAQLAAAARWLKARYGVERVRILGMGPRAQLAALTSAALERGVFSEAGATGGLESFGELFAAPRSFYDLPEIFAFGLYKSFDIKDLEQLAKVSGN